MKPFLTFHIILKWTKPVPHDIDWEPPKRATLVPPMEAAEAAERFSCFGPVCESGGNGDWITYDMIWYMLLLSSTPRCLYYVSKNRQKATKTSPSGKPVLMLVEGMNFRVRELNIQTSSIQTKLASFASISVLCWIGYGCLALSIRYCYQTSRPQIVCWYISSNKPSTDSMLVHIIHNLVRLDSTHTPHPGQNRQRSKWLHRRLRNLVWLAGRGNGYLGGSIIAYISIHSDRISLDRFSFKFKLVKTYPGHCMKQGNDNQPSRH